MIPILDLILILANTTNNINNNNNNTFADSNHKIFYYNTSINIRTKYKLLNDAQ